jgi:phosphatidylethanolamine/phosphatidyl-N-methylethanolamine N-methyltransferase
MISREKRLFFLGWLRSPLEVGIPVASSRSLARAMAAQIEVGPDEYVLELGAGTGAVTRALLSAGIRPQRLVIIERDQGFLHQLKHNFPQAIILKGDARNLKELLQQHQITNVAYVVSSLPLLNMPQPMRHDIVRAAFDVIKPSGMYIQYTYGLLSPLSPEHQRKIGISGQVAKRVWRNFPPARVWCYSADRRQAKAA